MDNSTNKADTVDLTTNNIIRISNAACPIQDLKTLKSPLKIVLLKRLTRTKILKTVFSFNRSMLTKTEIPLDNRGETIKWVAPTGTQSFFGLVNVATGTKTITVEGIFKAESDYSGWHTEFNNNQLFVGDMGAGSWSVYS